MEKKINPMRQQLHKLAESYTPEWNFTQEDPDAGSVLGILVADMLEGSRKKLESVMHKHKLQYMNRFDALLKEPASSARSYVQMIPVAGSEEWMPVPKGTELSAEEQEHEMIFQTMHDICLRDSHLLSVTVTDGNKDSIVHLPAEGGFTAFDDSGENQAFHGCLICYEGVLDGCEDLELCWILDTEEPQDAVRTAALLASDAVEISILEEETEGRAGYRYLPFDRITAEENRVILKKTGYAPREVEAEGRRGYFFRIRTVQQIPEITLSGLRLGIRGQDILPDMIQLDGVDTGQAAVSPFGTPMQLLAECRLDSREVLSKKGAMAELHFFLDFQEYEEKLELADVDIDYKTIMKRPAEVAQAAPAKVHADRIVWEYLSTGGWKRLLEDGDAETLMNGDKKGEITLRFPCPEDLAAYDPVEPRLRIRLLRAENIYKIPAVYYCPVMRHMRFSYHYKERERLPEICTSINNYHKKDCLSGFHKGADVQLFYATERRERSMYLCFDHSVHGMPFSLYLDLENYSDLPLDFTVEYGRRDDFGPVRMVDGTGSMLHSGILQLLIPQDMEEKEMFGRRGYFLRFTCYEEDYPSYRLPWIRNVYLNMVKVENRSSSTEYFFIEEKEEPLTVKLRHENIRQLRVWVKEGHGEKDGWKLWKQATGSLERGRVYHADMAAGTVSFPRFSFSELEVTGEEPEIRIDHRSYSGEAANVPAGSILTLRDSNRYVSEVIHPFPAYGGYDSYTEESTAGHIGGILRSRQRAVTEKDILDLLRQTSYSVMGMKCCLDVDGLGNPAPGTVSIAVLTKECEKGSSLFYEIQEEMKKRLEQTGNFRVMGREIVLMQPHFLRLNIRVWLEKESMENVYDLQTRTEQLLKEFLHPLTGGLKGTGWEIGSFPRVSQILACLRKRLTDATVVRMAVTALSEDRETEIKEDISAVSRSPFILPMSGEHVIHIDLKRH